MKKSYRDKNGKVKHRTLANLSNLPIEIINQLGILLKNGIVIKNLSDIKELSLKQGKNYGAIKVIYEIAKRLNIVDVLGNSFKSILALIIIAGIIIIHKSKYHISNFWAKTQAIEEVFKLKRRFDEDDLYQTLFFLSENQLDFEEKLFKESKNKENAIFLYDITSSYVYGKKMEMCDYGYNRDKKKGTRQIVIGLMTDKDGDPISIEVFNGNTIDNKRVFSQLEKLIKEKVIDITLFDEKLCGKRYIFRKNRVRGIEDWIAKCKAYFFKKKRAYKRPCVCMFSGIENYKLYKE